jgi:hypothetical protein
MLSVISPYNWILQDLVCYITTFRESGSRCPFSEFKIFENTGIISSALLLFDARFRQISIYKTTWQIDLWQLGTLLQLLHYFFDVTPGSTMCPAPVSMRTTVLQPAEEPFVTVREPLALQVRRGATRQVLFQYKVRDHHQSSHQTLFENEYLHRMSRSI